MTAPTKAQIERARAIGADIWERRALAWRERERLPDDPRWRETCRNGWLRGDYDAEDAVQAALAALAEAADEIASLRARVEAATEEAARIAELYIINGNSIHPDIPANQMAPAARMIAHTTCQHVAEAIRQAHLIKDSDNAE